MTRRALPQGDADALKLATRLLVHDCGGLEPASAACGLSTTSLSDAKRREHPERWLPLDAVLALERFGASRAVTEVLARAHRCVLVPVEAVGAGDLAVRLAQLGREVGEVFAAASLALADGVVTDAERAELGRELSDVVQAAQAALGALGEQRLRAVAQ